MAVAALDLTPGPATSLVLLGTALLAALGAAGVTIARHPRRRQRASGQVARELARSRLRHFLRRRFDPAEVTGLALTVALLLLFLAALAFGTVADMVTSRTGLYRLDAAAAAWGARNATPQSTTVLRLLTWLGSTLVVCLLAVGAGLYDWYRHRRWTVLAFMITVVLGQNLVSNGIKLLLHRERPPAPRLADASGWSFPSGHSASAAATYAAFALLLSRRQRWSVRAWLSTAAAGVIVLVAASRVLLGVHWVTDVVAGVMLGLGWFVVCSIAFGGSVLRFGATAQAAKVAAGDDLRHHDDWQGDRREA